MNTRSLLLSNALCVGALLGLAAGCKGLPTLGPPDQDLTQKRRQRTEEAAREFEAKRDLAELQAALARWDQGDVKGCEHALQRLLERNPNHREARLLMAEVCLADNRPQAAFSQAEQALLAYPDDAHVQYTVGLLLDATGQGETALAHYERAAELEPDDELYTVSHRNALRAAEGVGPSPDGPTGQPADSSQASLELESVVPDHTAQTSQPARSVVEHRPNRPKTAAPADDAPQPSTTPPRTSHAETGGRVDPADFTETAVTDRVRALLDKGRTALAEGAPETALVRFQEAAAVCPNNPQIPISAAMAALRHNQPDLAVELLRPVAVGGVCGCHAPPPHQGSSASAQAYRILGVAYYRLGDCPSSQVALQKALSLDKSSPLSYFLMGCTLAKLGRFESAEAHFRQAQAIDPRYAVRR